MSTTKPPTFALEKELFCRGYRAIVGVDEAGCGSLAGPVIAAAVILPFSSRLGMIRDSKLLSADQREDLFEKIYEKKFCGFKKQGFERLAAPLTAKPELKP